MNKIWQCLPIARRLWLAAVMAAWPLHAQTSVNWNSDPDKTNLTSSGSLLDGAVNFELGVFAGDFVPSADNIAAWAAHWHPASRTAYDPATRRYAALFKPTDNDQPFTVGRAAYVWGFRGDPSTSEWILLRAANWTWPDATTSPPANTSWYANAATAVLGTLHATGDPFLMQTFAVSNAAPPNTSWAQWQRQTLTGEPLNQPTDDPDEDGAPNLLEYVFATPPMSAGTTTAMPLAMVGGYLQITIPRRSDHPATLLVEVSADLTTWHSGAGYTEVLSDGLAALVVRDLLAVDAAQPRHFFRLKAELPAP